MEPVQNKRTVAFFAIVQRKQSKKKTVK